MRSPGLLFAAACVASLSITCALAQSGDEHAVAETGQAYASHQDARHGHNRVYPDRGAIFRELPRGSLAVNHGGLSYRFHEGVFFQAQGPAFLVVAPPIGLVVPTLPASATSVSAGAETYLYANSIYYRPRPDLGGYEVVNDPGDAEIPSPGSPSGPGGAPGEEEPPPVVNPAPPALAAAAAIPQDAASPPRPALSEPTGPQAPPAPPATAPSVAAMPPGTVSHGLRIVAYPQNGQSLDQQARDRYECYRFAVMQSGFDPMRAAGGAAPTAAGDHGIDYDRAQAACFLGRGYTLR